MIQRCLTGNNYSKVKAFNLNTNDIWMWLGLSNAL